jgi:hypothetical protein
MNGTRSAITIGAIALAVVTSTASAQQPWQWNGRVDAGKAIEIKGVNGGIRAVAGNSDEVRVTATKSAKRSDPAEVRIEVVPHAGGVTICAVYPTTRGEPNECRPGEGGRMNVQNNDVQVEFVVQVPPRVNFVGRSVNGAIEATGLSSAVDANTVNGAINISTAAVARANTVNGTINAELGRADWTGSLAFNTTNGNITISLPGNLNAQLTASTVNGDIETGFPIEVRGRFGPRRLTGTVGSGGRELSLNTVNGNITIQRR